MTGPLPLGDVDLRGACTAGWVQKSRCVPFQKPLAIYLCKGVTHLLLFLTRFLFSFGSTRPLAGLQVAYCRFLGGVLTITHLLSVSCPSILKHVNLLHKHNCIS